MDLSYGVLGASDDDEDDDDDNNGGEEEGEDAAGGSGESDGEEGAQTQRRAAAQQRRPLREARSALLSQRPRLPSPQGSNKTVLSPCIVPGATLLSSSHLRLRLPLTLALL